VAQPKRKATLDRFNNHHDHGGFGDVRRHDNEE
jgi:hypothetical protein